MMADAVSPRAAATTLDGRSDHVRTVRVPRPKPVFSNWAKHEETGRLIDATAAQFVTSTGPYVSALEQQNIDENRAKARSIHAAPFKPTGARACNQRLELKQARDAPPKAPAPLHSPARPHRCTWAARVTSCPTTCPRRHASLTTSTSPRCTSSAILSPRRQACTCDVGGARRRAPPPPLSRHDLPRRPAPAVPLRPARARVAATAPHIRPLQPIHRRPAAQAPPWCYAVSSCID